MMLHNLWTSAFGVEGMTTIDFSFFWVPKFNCKYKDETLIITFASVYKKRKSTQKKILQLRASDKTLFPFHTSNSVGSFR